MADLEDDIRAHIAWSLERPFVWGDHDCLTGFVAGWIMRRRGLDVAARWRRRYSTAYGAALIVHRGGGMASFLAAGLGDAGLEVTDEPRAGDVGALKVYGEDGPTFAGALCVGLRWTALAPGGLVAVPPPAVIAWRV